MKTIRKTGTKATYFKGNFYLYECGANWASPISFPTVFVAYGKGVCSGYWQACTGINTPEYVINHYFNRERGILNNFWDSVFDLEKITWADVNADKQNVLNLINLANNELLKLNEL